MIKKLIVKNFKSLLDIDVDFSNLNILAGINGLGKSSLIQVLLLIRQSYLKNLYPQKGILLNGELISLGKGKDILNISTNEKEIYFNVVFSDYNPLKIVLEYNQDSDFLNLSPTKSLYKEDSFGHQLFDNRFKYLNAERISPRLAYEAPLFEVLQRESIGIHGEFTPLFLALKKREPLKILNRFNIKSTSNTLIDQVSAWISEISPGFNLDSTYLPEVEYASLIYKYLGGEDLFYDFTPPNVGFGLTYVLPIITLIIASKPGDILVLENPESHLHPQGQNKLGELLFYTALDGVQLFVETHSDHILNGIRLAINRIKKNSEYVKLLFFNKKIKEGHHLIEIDSPKLNNNGRIDNWPDGFFDQWEKSLLELL